MLILVCYTTTLVLLGIMWKKKPNIQKIIILNAIIMYFILLVTVTQFPSGNGEGAPNFIPFVNMCLITPTGYIFDTGFFFRYLISSSLNVAMFFPLGIIIASLFRNRPKSVRVLICLLCGFVVSTIIELIQLALPFGRVFDIDDVIFNSLGAVLGGVLLFALCKNAVIKRFFDNNF